MHPCARCATLQRTCCERAEVVVTPGDVARIRRHTGRHDFWERRRPEDPADALPDTDDPTWARGTVAPDGTRRVLRKDARGACTFLGSAGCSLPEGARPSICRLYPLLYTERGLAVDESSHWCPVGALAAPGQPMADVLGMDRDLARLLVARLYAELRKETHADADRTDLRPAC